MLSMDLSQASPEENVRLQSLHNKSLFGGHILFYRNYNLGLVNVLVTLESNYDK